MAISDIYRGSTKRYIFTFTEPITGAVINITGWKIYFTLKNSINDVDPGVLQIITTAGDDTDDDAINGVMHLTVSSSNSDIEEDTYHYDFTRVIPGGTPNVVPMEVGTVDILKRATINAV